MMSLSPCGYQWIACVTVVRLRQDKQMINTGEVKSAADAADPEASLLASVLHSNPNKIKPLPVGQTYIHFICGKESN